MRRIWRARAELLSLIGLGWVDAGAWMVDGRLGAIMTGVILLVVARAANDA